MDQAETPKLKVFVSYSRRDSVAADALVEALSQHGFEVKIDRRDLPFGEKWQIELANFIRLSDTVIWLISEASVRSKWVSWELDEVAKRNKRLVPVLIAETTRETLPRKLGEIHILPAMGLFDLKRDLETLISVLQNDRAWLIDGTRLSDRSAEWIAHGQTPALLLRGASLVAAESWKERQPVKCPLPPSEVLDLILSSRQYSVRRQKLITVSSLLAASFAFGLAFLAYLQRNEALVNQSHYLAGLSSKQTALGDAGTGALLALEALPRTRSPFERPLVEAAEQRLYEAVSSLRETRHTFNHNGPVNSVSLDRERNLVVTASDDGHMALLRTSDLSVIRSIRGHAGHVYRAIFSKNGRYILSGSADGTARYWSVDSEIPIWRFQHDSPVTAVAINETDTLASTGDATGKVCFWDLESGQRKTCVGVGSESINSLSFIDADRVIVATDEGIARVYIGDQMLHELPRHSDAVLGAVVTKPAAAVGTFSFDGTWQLWALANQSVTPFKGHAGPVRSLDFSQDGLMAATGSDDGTVRIWPLGTAASVKIVELGNPIWKVKFLPDGRRLLSADRAGRLTLIDVASGSIYRYLMGHEGWIYDFAIVTSGAAIISVSIDHSVRKWTLDDTATITSVARSEQPPVMVSTLDSEFFNVVSIGGGVREYRWLDRTPTARNSAPVNSHARPLKASGRSLLFHEPNVVHVFDIDKHDVVRTIRLPAQITAAALTRDGVLITGDSHGRVRIEHSQSDESGFLELVDHKSEILDIAVDAKGDRVASSSADGRVKVWDRIAQQTVFDRIAHDDATRFVLLDKPGDVMVSASNDGTAKLWSVGKGNVVVPTMHGGMPITQLTVTPDWRRIITGHSNGVVRLWDRRSGRLEMEVTLHGSPVESFAVHSAGTHLLSLSRDGELLTLRLFSGIYEAIDFGHSNVARCLTRNQRLQNHLSPEKAPQCQLSTPQ